MQYISTRGEAKPVSFSKAVLEGLAPDGGLYMPETWPQLSHDDLRSLRGKTYQDIAFSVLYPFVEGDLSADEFRQMINESYASFNHPAIVPLRQSGANSYILELYHGPTLAFKDVAMQLLGRLINSILIKEKKRSTIVCATSGDTGAAAVHAFGGQENCDLFILLPNGRVSPVQQRQMTTSGKANVHALLIDGTFDDCQNLVKGMFANPTFRDTVSMSGVNSINWARIMAQMVYYFTAAISLGAPERKCSFSVPTGNFGDIYAGYAAKRMGLPIEKLIIASNENDILTRTLETGTYEMRGVVATSSPSMDIQISSNFERLLFEASGRDVDVVRRAMASLKQNGTFTLSDNLKKSICEDFQAAKASQEQCAQVILSSLQNTGALIDPHTACGVFAAEKFETPHAAMITLSTAHPAKFPDAVESACGIKPELPQWLGDLYQRDEKYTELSAEQAGIETYIINNTHSS